MSTFGVGTNGTTAHWPGGNNSSVYLAVAADGGAAQDYRIYSSTGLYLPNTGVYAAGTTLAAAGPPVVFDARNDQHPYYDGLGGVFAPAEQQALYSPAQATATRPGTPGLRWHAVEIEKIGDVVTWTMSGKLIAMVNVATVPMNGNNIFFGHSDIAAAASTDPLAGTLLFTPIDNIVVTNSEIPEPSSIALCGVGLVALAARRRRNA